MIDGSVTFQFYLRSLLWNVLPAVEKISDLNHAMTWGIHPVLSKAYCLGLAGMLACTWLTQSLAEDVAIKSRIRCVLLRCRQTGKILNLLTSAVFNNK